MIRSLRAPNTRVDAFKNDVRGASARSSKVARNVYLLCVAAFFVWLADLLFGSYFFLEAEAIVSSERIVVASPYDTQVTRLAITSGQRVHVGDLIAQVHSTQVTLQIATLASAYAETFARQAEINMRAAVSGALSESASARLADADALMAKVNERRTSGDISSAFLASTTRDFYQAKQELETRNAERESATRQIAGLGEALRGAQSALEGLRKSYAEGRIVAAADGLVGPVVASPGAVLRAGEPLTEMYVGAQFALAYLKTGTLFAVHVGDRVTLADGFHTAEGTVAAILPVTQALPPEFQRTLNGTSRGQVAKITLDDAAAFPMWSKLTVSGPKIVDWQRLPFGFGW